MESQQNPIRVILVDDHETIHREIGGLLTILEDIDLVAEAYTGEEAIALCDQHHPDIVLMDISMPELDGISATKVILSRHPDIRVLAMTGMDDAPTVQNMLAAGAVGYILKSTLPEELASILRATYNDSAVFSSKVAKLIMNPRPTANPRRDFGLTPREIEILQLLVDGKTNPEIADALTVSLATVKFHASNILHKLDVKTRAAAVRLAVEQRLLE